jgi:hypothetical protein
VLQPFLEGNIFRTYIINKYYDFNDIENPLKTYVDDTIYEEVDLYLTKRKHIFIRENRVTEYNSIWPWASPKEYKFYSMSKSSSMVMDAIEENSSVLTQFEISMDSQIDIYERRVFNLLDIFSELGGIYEIIKILGGLLIIPLNTRANKIRIVNEMLSTPSLCKSLKPKNTRDKSNKIDISPQNRSVSELNKSINSGRPNEREEDPSNKVSKF